MTEDVDNTNYVNIPEEKNSNIELIYSYTEALLKAHEESLRRLDTKLSAFLAFAGVSLRFAVDLPDRSALLQTPLLVTQISLSLKSFACGLSSACILVCAWGLAARLSGSVVDPEALMSDELYWKEDQRFRAFIVNTWIETQKEYKVNGLRKGRRLKLAIKLICGAAVAFALNVILLSFYR